MARVLVGSEVALTLVLLVSGVLLLSAFNRLERINPGFEPRGLVGGQIRLPLEPPTTEAGRAAFVDRVLERVSAIPTVTDAAVTLNRFIPGFAIITLIDIEGRPSPDGQSYSVQLRRVSPGYFRTMRIPVRAGRTFTAADNGDAPRVVAISQSFADRFWPGEDPIGRQVRRANVLYTVVGVVGDVRDVSLSEAEAPALYIPYPQNNTQTAPISLVVRTTRPPSALAADLRAAVFAVDAGQPVDAIVALEQFLADSAGPERFRSTLLLALAGFALLLSLVGIYGVTTRAVADRRREMGVRLALGAAPAQVWRLMVGQAMLAVGLGVAAGGVASLLAAEALARVLPGSVGSPLVPGLAVTVALCAAALVAAAVPARVVTLDPAGVLRRV